MAASSILIGNTLGVSYQIGVDSKGNDVFKGQSFKNISSTATDEDLITLADAIGEILENNITTIKKELVYIVTRA